MHKSSVYLPHELKDRLAAVAARSGRSEADLIRSAIDHLVGVPAAVPDPADADVPVDVHVDVRRPGIVAVGVGPGDPDLVTIRARAALVSVDRILALTTDARAVGRAEMTVRAIAPHARVTRIPFAIGNADAARRRSLLDVVDAVLAGTDVGEAVALALLGDPVQWSIYPAVADEIRHQRPDLHVTAVAGLTAYQSAAAEAGIALGGPSSPLIVVDNVDDLDRFLQHANATVVLFKAVTDAETLQRLAATRERRGVVTELPGLPGHRTTAVEALPVGPMPYLATAVFPARTRARSAVA